MDRICSGICSYGTRYIKEKWEREANMIISVDDWEEIVGQQWQSTCSLSWRDHGWKNVIRFFRTQAQVVYHNTKCW